MKWLLGRHRAFKAAEGFDERQIEKLGARIAFFWGPDGEKLELFEPGASV